MLSFNKANRDAKQSLSCAGASLHDYLIVADVDQPSRNADGRQKPSMTSIISFYAAGVNLITEQCVEYLTENRLNFAFRYLSSGK